MSKNMKTERDILIEISNKLDKLIGISAIHGKSKDEQVKILTLLGFSNGEISMTTGIPKGTVDSIRSKIKRS